MNAINHLPIIDLSKSTTGCCSLIEPAEWDEQVFTFDNKLFATAMVRSFLYIPLNMGSVMKKAQAKIDQAGANVDDFIILSEETSPWQSKQYFAGNKEVPGLETARLSGTYMTKVFEGPYKDAEKWHRQLIDYVISAREEANKTYFFYTTCPKCAKTYGKNYVIGFAKID